MRKVILLGCLTGVILAGGLNADAMSCIPEGTLYTQNPIISAPKGYARTIGPTGTISAKCTVSKSGYTTKSTSVSGQGGSMVETDWIYGPTYASSGTKFKSNHTGYRGDNGAYWTASASKSY